MEESKTPILVSNKRGLYRLLLLTASLRRNPLDVVTFIVGKEKNQERFIVHKGKVKGKATLSL